MFDEIISDTWKKIIVKEVISLAYSEIKSYLKKVNRKIISNDDDFRESLKPVIKDIFNWSGFIQSAGLYGSNNTLLNHYIELDFYLVPLRYQYKQLPPTTNLVDKLSKDNERNTVIFGLPGMGKTTSMKMIAYKLVTDESFLPNYFSIPIVLRFRELKGNFTEKELKQNSHNIIFIYIFNLFNIKFNIENEKAEEIFQYSHSNILREVAFKILDRLKLILIFDGFDEIEQELRHDLFSQIKEISYKTVNTKILLTSRTGEFSYNVENFHYYEIAPLSNQQIKIFSQKWLGELKYDTFISKLENSSFFDTAIRPLILSFLCVIYLYNDELPNKPKFIYQEIIDLLLERWDKERAIGRKSKFSNFNKNQKLEFIKYLAFYLIIDSKYFFNKHDIQIAYTEIAEEFELDKFKYQEVINEIEEYSGIFIQSGADRYEFPHKSIQEFLAAEYLVKYHPISNFKSKFFSIPNELAIVIALSTNQNEKLIEIINLVDFSKKYEAANFIKIFLLRLLSESPIFKTNSQTAIKLCQLLSRLKNEFSFEDFTFFKTLYECKGIYESFSQLENEYSCEPELSKNLMKKTIINPNELIKIYKRNSQESLLIYFKFIENWRYVKPHIS